MRCYKYSELGECDDLAVYTLLEQAHYWGQARRIIDIGSSGPPVSSLSDAERQTLRDIIQNYIEEEDEDDAFDAFVELPRISSIYRRKKEHLQELLGVLTRLYLSMYQRSCQFDVEVTTRYMSRSRSLQACVISNSQLDRGVLVEGLVGWRFGVPDIETATRELPGLKDVSTFLHEGQPCMLCGPLRFVNHDCEANTRFVSLGGDKLGLRTQRPIDIGEQLTVHYSNSFFGAQNCNCLCASCEAAGRNGWDPGYQQAMSDDDSDHDHDRAARRKKRASCAAAREVEISVKASMVTQIVDAEDESSDEASLTTTSISSREITRRSSSPFYFNSLESVSLRPPGNLGRVRTRGVHMAWQPKLIGDSTKTIFDKVKEFRNSYFKLGELRESKTGICSNCLCEDVQEWRRKGYSRFCRRCQRHAILYSNFWPNRIEGTSPIILFEHNKSTEPHFGPEKMEGVDFFDLTLLQKLHFMHIDNYGLSGIPLSTSSDSRRSSSVQPSKLSSPDKETARPRPRVARNTKVAATRVKVTSVSQRTKAIKRRAVDQIPKPRKSRAKALAEEEKAAGLGLDGPSTTTIDHSTLRKLVPDLVDSIVNFMDRSKKAEEQGGYPIDVFSSEVADENTSWKRFERTLPHVGLRTRRRITSVSSGSETVKVPSASHVASVSNAKLVTPRRSRLNVKASVSPPEAATEQPKGLADKIVAVPESPDLKVPISPGSLKLKFRCPSPTATMGDSSRILFINQGLIEQPKSLTLDVLDYTVDEADKSPADSDGFKELNSTESPPTTDDSDFPEAPVKKGLGGRYVRAA